MKEIAEENQWSYISMKRNNVCAALNTAISLFPHATSFFKLDEDIFVTNGFFENLPAIHELSKVDYRPCFTAPLILVNFYTYRKMLEKLDLVETYTKEIEYPAMRSFTKIERDDKASRFMWGEGGYVPQLDSLNKMFMGGNLEYETCPIRFSIGAIYFEKELLETYGYIPVTSGTDMGADEVFLSNIATSDWRAIIVSLNCVVGHLSYSPQNKGMRAYYQNHPEFFCIN